MHNMQDIVSDFALFLIEKTRDEFYQSYYKLMFQLYVTKKIRNSPSDHSYL